jgi:CobQ-like glutamine amidotransferase family enzyme
MALGTPLAQVCPGNLLFVQRYTIHRREHIQGEGIFDYTVETREDLGEDGPGR